MRCPASRGRRWCYGLARRDSVANVRDRKSDGNFTRLQEGGRVSPAGETTEGSRRADQSGDEMSNSNNAWHSWANGHLPPPQLDQMQAITQQELQRLRELEPLAREHRELRQSIRDRSICGAETERGRYSVSITEQTVRRFSQERLERVLGAAYVSQLKNRIEPTTQRILRVIDQHAEAGGIPM